MTNKNTKITWQYHNATKHSYWSVRSNPHYLDWSNRPQPFKIYRDLEPMPLPRDIPRTDTPVLAALALPSVEDAGETIPDQKTLAHILYFAAGVTKRKTYPVGEILFRAASCTGALYEFELYLVCGELPDLAAGIYHFNPGDFALRRLRVGDFRGVLARATAQEPSVTHAPVTLACAGIYWRNSWKYQARTYRHFGWDNGTMLANLLAASRAWRLPARVVCGFQDDEVNRLLALDPEREVAFSLVPLGRVASPPPPAPGDITPLQLHTLPYSRTEADYPLMRQMHQASSLCTEREVAEWRGQPPDIPEPANSGKTYPLQVPELFSGESLEQTILRRGSSRKFAQKPISFAQLSASLHSATRGIPADFLHPPGKHLNQLYVIVHAVDGLPAGTYYYRPERDELVLLREGSFRSEAYYLGLEQELPGEAAFAVFYLTDLHRVLERFGNRGYRAAQLEAGILGGKLYLAAYAQRLGATGLTFYDDDVVKFFSPHAEGKNTTFLMAAGKSGKERLVAVR